MTLTQLAPWAVMIVGAAVMLLGLYVLVRAHFDRSSPINLAYLLVDGSLQPARVTLAKAAGLGSFLASTWWITWLVVADKADSAMITGYIIGWGAVKVGGDITALRERAMGNKVDNPDA